MSKVLKTENLKKSYSGKTVVDEVNINLKKGRNCWIAWSKWCW
ncbi:MAG: hypothetical protein Ct9H300mP24_6660 [Candidatus Neomarinimicrobiota bacterium]|nr:MAG: hypothetical protein Ct9H300mP24_6660 [Candidatus Neomarinimicrobiota bacterium]